MIVWLFLAAALALLPPARVAVDRAPAPRPPVPRRALQLLAASALAAAAVAALGVGAGGLVGALAVAVSWRLVGSLHDRPPARGSPAELALALDLVAVVLRSGQPLAAALMLAAPAADPATSALLSRVGGMLRLGAEPGEAWAVVAGHAVLEPVATAARRSADSGIRLAGAFAQLAADVRADAESAAEARAHRAGILAVAPLGLCFLPAFVCIGIVPVVVGIAGHVLTSLR